jgi:hypothetical protein
MNPEIEWELFEFVQQEKSWNEVCAKIKQPMSIIAIGLQQLSANNKITHFTKEDNIYYVQKHANQGSNNQPTSDG